MSEPSTPFAIGGSGGACFPGGTGGMGPPGPPGPPGNGSLLDLSVNTAQLNQNYASNAIVLRTGSKANTAGAYNGGGVGNKAIACVRGFSGLPLASLLSLSYTWENVLGPAGPNFNPPGAATVLSPYINLIVDFGGGVLRVLILCSDSLVGTISAAIGTYSNPGGLNVLTFSWNNAKDVIIVGSPPAPSPGGVPVDISVGPGHLNNAYKFSALVAANPLATLIDAFTGDSGLPVGAITPAIMLISGDSGNLTKSGKKFTQFLVNGTSVL